MFATIITWLKQRSKIALVATALAYVALVGVADSFTPPVVIFAVFDIPAVMLVTWFAGRTAGIVIAVASSVSWLIVGHVTALPGTPPAIPYWNAINGLVAFLAVAFLVAAVKTLNERLEERVERRTQQLRAEIASRIRLEKEVLEVTDQEQRRIGQDLHDGLCQHLTATRWASKILQEELTNQSLPAAAQAKQIGEFIEQAIRQSRHIARGLDPVKVATNGLMSALEELAATIQSLNRINCVFRADAPVLLDDHASAIHLYRIAQEAVNNALKHAQPTRIEIALRQTAGQCQLTITDDGVGLPATAPAGMGLHTMNYRAGLIGATLEIRRPPTGGTVVACALPRDG